MIVPAVNERDLNTRKSTNGCGSRSSRTMKKINPTTAVTVSSAIVAESNQSSRWPRSSTYCNDAIPIVIAPRPIKSAPRSGFWMYAGSRMKLSVITKARIPIGILMKKISGHE